MNDIIINGIIEESQEMSGEIKYAIGVKGDDGVGISDISKTSTEGNVDTYTIMLTDGTTKTFTVTNGISVTTASINLSGHLIITLNDGTNVDAGMVKEDIEKPSWHNIETINTTEVLGTVTRKFGALNGEITYPAAAKVSKIQVYLTMPPNAGATTTRIECRISDKNSTRIYVWDYVSTTDTKVGWILIERHAKWVPTFSAPQSRSESSPNTSSVQILSCSADNLIMTGTENVRYLSFYGQLPAGTVIDIWGYYDEN